MQHSPVKKNNTMSNLINEACVKSHQAWVGYREKTYKQRENLLVAIAREIEALGDVLIETAMEETNLPQARLTGERGRTCNQLRAYGKHITDGYWANACIDTAIPDRQPLPKVDIRKVNQPIGPIVVFGASNFPFAYSTAGGDTASALAAGCTVLLKAHPAHLETSRLVASAITKALVSEGLSEDIFIHVEETDFSAGKALVQHPNVKGVGFTGSFGGGMALVKYAQERAEPIPVFSEMGSINPVLILHETYDESLEQKINQLAGAITLGVGQFCTNPGLVFGLKGPVLDKAAHQLGTAISKVGIIGKMLHPGIAKSYVQNYQTALDQQGVEVVARSVEADEPGIGLIAKTSSATFAENKKLHQEIFGPYSLIVECDDLDDLLAVYEHLEGQLTSSIFIEPERHDVQKLAVAKMIHKSGRVIINGVPTGVEVCHSMVHGGPFPSTTDGRFTSVGQDSILRWVRPVCYQSFPDAVLPVALQNDNPLNIARLVNGVWSTASI